MAKVFINKSFTETGNVWERKAGATRHQLGIIIANGIDNIDYNKPFTAKLGYQTHGKQSFITIMPSSSDNKTLGIFINDDYGFTCCNEEKEVFSASSSSTLKWYKMGIYEVGAILKVHTYKNRTPSSYIILTSNGWKFLGTKNDVIGKAMEGDKDALMVAEVKGFLNNMNEIE